MSLRKVYELLLVEGVFVVYLIFKCLGDQLSKKSLSLVPSENDLEAQRSQDESKTPLMKEKEKGRGRLIVRQHLFAARRITSDYALFFSVFGICK